MCDRADSLAAVLHDDLCRIAFERAAESVIGGEEKPSIAAALDDFLCGSDRKRMGVKHPLHCIERTEFAVKIVRARRVGKQELFAVICHLLKRRATPPDREIDEPMDID